MSSVVSVARSERCAIVAIDNPPVNAMSAEVRRGLLESLGTLAGDDSVDAILLICRGRTFVAGADLKEFDTGVTPPGYHETFAAIETCSRPVVVALHGTALGAGAELALACHYRCAASDAKLGLPELTLGIIPGAGGTQRLPRLIGARRALELIIDAGPQPAARALELGLIDRLIEGDLEAGALAYVEELLARGAGPRRTADMPVDATGFDDAAIDAALAGAAKRMRGQRAPERAVSAIRAAIELPLAAGLEREAAIANEALASTESKALRHLFFAEREVARIPGLRADVLPLDVQRVGIIGAGTMGRGIAIACADAGLEVQLLDGSTEALRRGLDAIRTSYESAVGRGRLTREQMDAREALIQPALDFDALGERDLVIEAVFEDVQLKQEIFARLGAICREDAVLASNTSTLDLDAIAASSGRPEAVVGLHFFSPANVMRLLEIVRGAHSSQRTLATALAVSKRLRKIGVVVGVCYGFVGNRMMLEGYVREADQLLLEGATPEQVDRVLEGFGFAMGPFRMNDMAGNDVGLRARETTGIRAQRPSPYHEVIDELARMGRLGQKTGAGFYRYAGSDRTPLHDPVTDEVIERVARKHAVRRRDVGDVEVLTRCVYPLINEGARILEEGIAYRSGDIDVIWTQGYGFPRFRGGPMCYADTLGLREVCAEIERLHAAHGHYWEPAPLLLKLARDGSTFGEWSAAAR